MSLTAIEYRQFAEECISIAEMAPLEKVAILHKMAETWLKLAEHLLLAQRTESVDQNAPSTEKVQ